MSVTFKQLLEASYHQVNVRVDELKRVLDLTKTYSIKTSSHIKIITSLVNELTDSEDTLTLIDTEVAAMAINQKYTHTTNINRQQARLAGEGPNANPVSHTVNVNLADKRSNFGDEGGRSVALPDRAATTSTNEQTRFQPNIEIKNNVSKTGEELALVKMLESYKQENQKLWDNLKKGQSDTDFIKSIFEKLLDTFTKQKPEAGPLFVKTERDSIQPCACVNCIKTANPQTGYPPQGVSQSCYVPQNQVKRKPGCVHAHGSEAGFEEESMRSMKEGGDGMRDADGRGPRRGGDSGINGMFKQYIDLKKEFERSTEEKNRQIADLTRLLEETRVRSELLLREIEELSMQKHSLEISARDLLTQTKLTAEKLGSGFEQKCKALERDVQRLEGQVEALTGENDSLRQKVKDNEKFKNEEDFYKVKLAKMENDFNDLQRSYADAKNRNGELVTLLEKSNEARSKTKIVSEASTVDYNDDLLKCMYSQADYIEGAMGTFFNDSIFKS